MCHALVLYLTLLLWVVRLPFAQHFEVEDLFFWDKTHWQGSPGRNAIVAQYHHQISQNFISRTNAQMSLIPVGRPQNLLHRSLLAFTFVICLHHLVHSHEGSLEGVEAWAIEHLLLDLAAVRAPRHQEDLRLEGGLRPVGVELIIIVIDAVTTVVSVPVLLVQVVQKVLIAVVPVSNRFDLDHPSLDHKGGIPVLLAFLNLLCEYRGHKWNNLLWSLTK